MVIHGETKLKITKSLFCDYRERMASIASKIDMSEGQNVALHQL
jgi:hypothetical protein